MLLNIVLFVVFDSLKKMARDEAGSTKGTSNINTMQGLSFHSSKINVKFDGIINFRMWCYEVCDTLIVQGLKDVIASNKKPTNTLED